MKYVNTGLNINTAREGLENPNNLFEEHFWQFKGDLGTPSISVRNQLKTMLRSGQGGWPPPTPYGLPKKSVLFTPFLSLMNENEICNGWDGQVGEAVIILGWKFLALDTK